MAFGAMENLKCHAWQKSEVPRGSNVQ
jgi:hypothetical protein